jgi:hypothetical protein
VHFVIASPAPIVVRGVAISNPMSSANQFANLFYPLRQKPKTKKSELTMVNTGIKHRVSRIHLPINQFWSEA